MLQIVFAKRAGSADYTAFDDNREQLPANIYRNSDGLSTPTKLDAITFDVIVTVDGARRLLVASAQLTSLSISIGPANSETSLWACKKTCINGENSGVAGDV